jgi:hypothetical protein
MHTVCCFCVWQVMKLANGLRLALLELPSVTVWDLGADRKPEIGTDDHTQSHGQCGLVTFSVTLRSSSSRSSYLLSDFLTCACVCVRVQVAGIDSVKIMQQLMAHAEITVSTSSPSSTLIDATQRELPIVVRASVSSTGRPATT